MFRFPKRVIFGGFLTEDKQKPKLVCAHPQILLLYKKDVGGIALLSTKIIALCYSDIPKCVADTKADIQLFYSL